MEALQGILNPHVRSSILRQLLLEQHLSALYFYCQPRYSVFVKPPPSISTFILSCDLLNSEFNSESIVTEKNCAKFCNV